MNNATIHFDCVSMHGIGPAKFAVMFNALTKYQSLIIYGLLIILTGIFLIAFQYKTSVYLQYAVATSILVSMFFAAVTAYKSSTMQVLLNTTSCMQPACWYMELRFCFSRPRWQNFLTSLLSF